MGDEGVGRRKLLTIAGGCAFGAAVGLPVLAFVVAPVSGAAGERRWVKTVRLEQLHENEPARVAVVDERHDAWTVERVELGSVWLVRRGDVVTALSAVCPHLGCSVDVAADKSGFACPCHTSAFDGDGKKKSGPSPRDLDLLPTRIDEGAVVVDFQKFKVGVAEKVPA